MWKIYLSSGKSISQKECSWVYLSKKEPILILDYFLKNGKTLRLTGFDEYMYFHEDYQFIYGLFKRNNVRITENFLGKKGNKIFQCSYSYKTGKLYQIQNFIDLPFRPLQIIPLPSINKKEPKQFNIEFGSARKVNDSLWRSSVSLNYQAMAKII